MPSSCAEQMPTPTAENEDDDLISDSLPLSVSLWGCSCPDDLARLDSSNADEFGDFLDLEIVSQFHVFRGCCVIER